MATLRKRTRRHEGPGAGPGGGGAGNGTVPARRMAGELRIGRALRGTVQAKLAVSRPGDPAEQEADRAAAAVTRGGDVSAVGLVAAPLVQRVCAGCEQETEELLSRKAGPTPAIESDDEKKKRERKLEEEKRAQAKHRQIDNEAKEKKRKLQKGHGGPEREDDEETAGTIHAKSDGAGPDVAPADAAARVRELGSGVPLPEHLRAFFEARFGRRFDGVRLHLDLAAGETAQAVGALAFTVRDQIAFAPGQFSPDTTEGRTLLAHEIAHVVQQGYAPPLEDNAAPASTSATTVPVGAAVLAQPGRVPGGDEGTPAGETGGHTGGHGG